MARASNPPSDDCSRPGIRSLEELMAAPTVETPDTLLTERGQIWREFGSQESGHTWRELGRRLTATPDELLDLLREER